MKRSTLTSVIFLFLVCVSHSLAKADTVRARILIGTREAVVAPAPVYDGARVLAPTGILGPLGASHVVSEDDNKVTVISANGQSGDVETVDVNGTRMLPMDKVIQIIGGETSWDDQTHTLTVLAQLKSVEFADGVLRINCSFPVSYSTGSWGGKIWVDVANTKLATETKEVYIGASGIQRARMAQFEPTTARVVLDLDKDLGYKVESKPVAAQILMRVGAGLSTPVKAQPQAARPSSSQPKSFKINEVRLEPMGNDRFDLVISTSSRGDVDIAYGVMPPALHLDLPGATLAVGAGEIENSHALLKNYKFSRMEKGPGGTRLELDLSRIAAYGVAVDNNAITITVRVPDKGWGKLSDKLIVIDPGHGGSQKGAQSSGLMEKDLNYQIAEDVAAVLKEQGARIMLTRDGDETLGLSARSEVAIYNKADFFLSFHCNSNGVANSATGIETYYHMTEGSPRALAYAIHAGVCAATGMCDRKPRSDRALYSSGLAVLRRLEGTNLPGILVECGYLNTASDRTKLASQSYRKKLAEGVVAGIKAYIEGIPITIKAGE